jgi:hypothetical protein
MFHNQQGEKLQENQKNNRFLEVPCIEKEKTMSLRAVSETWGNCLSGGSFERKCIILSGLKPNY